MSSIYISLVYVLVVPRRVHACVREKEREQPPSHQASMYEQVIADFANGEIKQAQALFDTEITFEDYMSKSFWKTASLIAASCKSSAIFSDVPPEIAVDIYNYGKHLGLAFQIVDDILDFTQARELEDNQLFMDGPTSQRFTFFLSLFQ